MDFIEPSKTLEVILTSEQMKQINLILPNGYCLQYLHKNKRESNSKSSKKLQMEGASYRSTLSQSERQSDKRNLGNMEMIPKYSNPDLTNQNLSTLPQQNSTILSKQNSLVSPNSQQSKDTKRSLRTKRQKGLSEELKKCNKILQQLKKHPQAYPFLQPVDPVELNCLNYFDVVKDPIDLQTIEDQLKEGMYQNEIQFMADVRKVWNNSFLYNVKGSQIYHMTQEMQNYFEKLNKENFEMNSSGYNGQQVKYLQKQVEKLSQELKELNSGKGKKGKATSKKNLSKMDQRMTNKEKKELGQQIRNLPPEYLKGVWEIVSKENTMQTNEKILEFDIDNLSVRITRELEQFVKQVNSQQKKTQKKQTQKSNKQIKALQEQMIPMQQQMQGYREQQFIQQQQQPQQMGYMAQQPQQIQQQQYNNQMANQQNENYNYDQDSQFNQNNGYNQDRQNNNDDEDSSDENSDSYSTVSNYDN